MRKWYSRRNIQFLAVLLCGLFTFMWMILSTSAQDDLHTYFFEDSEVSVTYADPWTISTNDDGSITLTDGSINVILYDSTYVSHYVKFDESNTSVVVLLAMGNVLRVDALTPFEQERLVEQPVGQRSVTTYLYVPQDNNMVGLFVVVLFSDGTYGFVDAQIPLNVLQDGQQAVLNLLETFNTTSITEPCTVSTDQEYIPLRVGPGRNRGEYTSMPLNHSLTVLGQVIVDESVWWKLDKNEIAPNGAANELWVAEADVTESSSSMCDSVPNVNELPPVRTPDGSQATQEQNITFTPTVTPSGVGPIPTPTPTSVFDPLCPGTTSSQFATNAWQSTDINVVFACVVNLRYWENQARAQQAARLASGLCDVQPTPDQSTAYFQNNWALSDLATGYFVLGLRYKDAGQAGWAQEAFNTIIANYSCAWAWDPRGWFWSLGKAAREQ